MDNVKEAVEKRGTTLREVKSEEIFMDKKKLRAFFSKDPRPTGITVQSTTSTTNWDHCTQYY